MDYTSFVRPCNPAFLSSQCTCRLLHGFDFTLAQFCHVTWECLPCRDKIGCLHFSSYISSTLYCFAAVAIGGLMIDFLRYFFWRIYFAATLGGGSWYMIVTAGESFKIVIFEGSSALLVSVHNSAWETAQAQAQGFLESFFLSYNKGREVLMHWQKPQCQKHRSVATLKATWKGVLDRIASVFLFSVSFCFSQPSQIQ